MSDYRLEDKEFELARDWAQMEGCEPSDLLETLIDATYRARDGYWDGYGYCMTDGDKMHDKLLECFREQYHGIRDAALEEIEEGDPYVRWPKKYVQPILDREAKLYGESSGTPKRSLPGPTGLEQIGTDG